MKEASPKDTSISKDASQRGDSSDTISGGVPAPGAAESSSSCKLAVASNVAAASTAPHQDRSIVSVSQNTPKSSGINPGSSSGPGEIQKRLRKKPISTITTTTDSNSPGTQTSTVSILSSPKEHNGTTPGAVSAPEPILPNPNCSPEKPTFYPNGASQDIDTPPSLVTQEHPNGATPGLIDPVLTPQSAPTCPNIGPGRDKIRGTTLRPNTNLSTFASKAVRKVGKVTASQSDDKKLKNSPSQFDATAISCSSHRATHEASDPSEKLQGSSLNPSSEVGTVSSLNSTLIKKSISPMGQFDATANPVSAPGPGSLQKQSQLPSSPSLLVNELLDVVIPSCFPLAAKPASTKRLTKLMPTPSLFLFIISDVG